MQVDLNPHCKHTAALDEGTLKIVATSGGACHRAVVTLLRERSVREWRLAALGYKQSYIV